MSKKKIILLSVVVLVLVILVVAFYFWKMKSHKKMVPVSGRTDEEILKELDSFPTMTKEALPPEHPLYNQVKTEKEIMSDLLSI